MQQCEPLQLSHVPLKDAFVSDCFLFPSEQEKNKKHAKKERNQIRNRHISEGHVQIPKTRRAAGKRST